MMSKSDSTSSNNNSNSPSGFSTNLKTSNNSNSSSEMGESTSSFNPSKQLLPIHHNQLQQDYISNSLRSDANIRNTNIPTQKLATSLPNYKRTSTSPPNSPIKTSPKPLSDSFVTTSLNRKNQLIELSGDPNSSQPKRKRNRPTISCMNCKKKKIKCDRNKPVCGSCVKNGHHQDTCIYLSSSSTNADYSNTTVNPSSSSANQNFYKLYGPNSMTYQSSVPPLHSHPITLPPQPQTSISVPTPIQLPMSRLPPSQQYHPNSSSNSISSNQTVEIEELRKALLQEQLKHEHESNLKDFELQKLLCEVKALRQYQESLTVSSNDQNDNSPFLNSIKYAHTRNIPNFAKIYRVEKNSASLIVGASCWRSAVSFDPNIGPLLKLFQKDLKRERREWKLKFQSKLNEKHSEIEKILDASSDKRSTLLDLIADYLDDYDTLIQELAFFSRHLNVCIGIVPESLLRAITDKHFVRTSNGKIKIVVSDKKLEYSCIALVLMAYKLVTAYKQQTDGSSHIDDEHDLLYFYSTKLLNEAKFQAKSSITSLLTLIAMYYISLKNLKRYECGDFKNSSVYSSMAIFMAYNLGIHRERSEYSFSVDYSDEEIKFKDHFSDDDWRRIWQVLLLIDAEVSFNSGTPSLIADGVFTTSRNLSDRSGQYELIGLMRQLNTLLTECNPNLRYTKPITLQKIEKLISDIERFNHLNCKSILDCRMDLPNIVNIGDSFLSLGSKFKSINMLLFLYNHVSRTLKEFVSSDDFQSLPLVEQLEFKQLKEKYAKRSLNFGIMMLSCLNYIISHNYTRNTNFNWLSTDLRNIFLRVTLILSSYLGEQCRTQPFTNQRSPNRLLLDELDLESIELLLYPNLTAELLAGTDQSKIERILKVQNSHVYQSTVEKLELPYKDPQTLITYFNGFFYSCSRLNISFDYNFFAVYKYIFLSFNYLKVAEKSLSELDRAAFLESVSNVDNGWFTGV
ncbi:hypothetical protein CANARDRAFT_26875 [[Candida] arabinofermentans NRRL YB-2248]|uniref:Zn(2)-C6 fungal-type domain-containing protein n=1 Tax=[Candida] arabinofermentans NRRL YB-2248 TaxID=983967 RepID=A0A1E4T745_9ASCO|nr:hypothetical protein CANARDRAFT_26875 [[Candida] arabinofermentans NRRL YB-2248]